MKFIPYNKNLIFENQNLLANPIQLDEIEEIAKLADTNMSQEFKIPKDVLDSFKIKDSLNPDVWQDGKLSPEISTKLLEIAKDFFDNLDIPKSIQIKDIIFTGSLANYNWSKFSDIDLHLIVDFKDFEMERKMLEDYFYAQKTLWNLEHNILVHNYPVEIYVQDVKDELTATAIYSIMKNKWLKKPKRESFTLDKDSIKAKTKEFIEKLKNIREDYKKEEYKKVVDAITKLKAKIKQMRKAGLESGGEFSKENLVFKVLRRTPYMELLDDYKSKAYDKLMSVMEDLNEIEQKPTNGVVFILGEKLEDGSQRLYGTIVDKVLSLDRLKSNNTQREAAKMAVFNNNQVFRIALVNGTLKALGVAWKDKNSMLDRLALTKTSVVLNSKTKTPYYWESLKHKIVYQALNELGPALQQLPNIRWIG